MTITELYLTKSYAVQIFKKHVSYKESQNTLFLTCKLVFENTSLYIRDFVVLFLFQVFFSPYYTKNQVLFFLRKRFKVNQVLHPRPIKCVHSIQISNQNSVDFKQNVYGFGGLFLFFLLNICFCIEYKRLYMKDSLLF